MLDAASGDCRRLDYVDRFTSIPVMTRETVSQHSYWVTFYSLLVHRAVEQEFGERFVGPICAYAVMHDFVECVSGDLVRTFKYSTPELKSAVDDAEARLAEGFDPRIKDLMSLPSAMIQSPSAMAYVKAVVKAADFVSLHQYMVREVSRGNAEIRPFFERMQRDLRAEGARYASSDDERVASIAPFFKSMASRSVTGRYTT